LKGPKSTACSYPIRAAARLSRLSIDTLRAWEKRYSAVKPMRQGGRRFYSEADIDRLALLRRAVEHGYSIGQASRLSNKELNAVAERGMVSRAAAPAEGPTETILAAIERFEYARADRELSRLASLMPPRDLVHNIALPLMRITGEKWHEQKLRIAQEHVMSQLLSNLLGGIMRTYAPADPPALIMTATLSSDLHEFGILAAAILAAGMGLGVVHLGPDLPAKEIIYAAKCSAADVVLLSVTNPQDRMLREEQLRSIRAGVSKETAVWAGVNPADAVLNVRGVLLLRNFTELEREFVRIGGSL
jgi:DNA-binding transcriptional MerR regulator/methylmalonyl-CoA mutase cobalamin-binding subunit